MSTAPRSHARRRAEVARILEAFDGSGLTQARFARQKGIPLATLRYWLRRRRVERNRRAAPGLVAVTLRPPIGATADRRIEITLGNGRELRLPIDTDAARVADLVAALER